MANGFCEKSAIRVSDGNSNCDRCKPVREQAIIEMERFYDQWEAIGGKVRLDPLETTGGFNLLFQCQVDGKWVSIFNIICQHRLPDREKNLHYQLQIPTNDGDKSKTDDLLDLLRICGEATERFRPRRLSSIPLAGIYPKGFAPVDQYNHEAIWMEIRTVVCAIQE